MYDHTCTCHTDDCPSNGIPVPMNLTSLDPETGQPVTVGTVICGACSREITDVQPIERPTEPAPV